MRKRISSLGPILLGAALSVVVVRFAFLWNLFPSNDLGKATSYVREVMQIMNQNYVDPSAAKYDALAKSAIAGMADSLDPHSEFLESADNKELEEELNGEFGGVGILVEILHGRAVVIAPMPGTPSERAGVQRGDQIASVDGQALGDAVSMDQIVKRLRGRPKTQVTMGLYRPSTRQKLTVVLTREIIKIDSVAASRVLPDDIGYIRLTEFSEHTGQQFDDALDGLLKQGIASLILDLRDNPGGIIDSAVDVAEPFFKKGELIVYTQGRTPADREDYTADTEGDPLDLPVAVLINAGTASAAEIVTGALKDTGRAVVVGERSFGKGSVQSIFKLKNGEGLRLTIAHYYTPSGVSIHQKGITPQVEVVMSPQEDQNLRDQYDEPGPVDRKRFKEEFGEDPVEDLQLDAARDVLKGVEILDDQVAATHKAASR